MGESSGQSQNRATRLWQLWCSSRQCGSLFMGYVSEKGNVTWQSGAAGVMVASPKVTMLYWLLTLNSEVSMVLWLLSCDYVVCMAFLPERCSGVTLR